MNYEHSQITVTEPAPGHFAISNIPACRATTDEGIVVAPSDCYISPAVPTELLKAIIAEREGKPSAGLTFAEVAQNVSQLEADEQSNDERTTESEDNELVAKILEAVKGKPQRIGDLADELGCTKDDIRALSSNGFEVAAAGWVKLLTVGGAD
jgi:hypothetical protein